MTKRAHSLLFTLFFFCCITTAFADVVSDQVVGGTKFESKTGSYPCDINGIKTYGEDSFSFNTTYKPGASTKEDKAYSVNGINNCFVSGSLNTLTYTHTINGLPKTGTHLYTIRIKVENLQEICIKATNYDRSFRPSDLINGYIEVKLYSSNGKLSYTFHEYGGQNNNITIKEIIITGDIEQKVVSAQGTDCCIGSENQLSVPAFPSNTKWYQSTSSNGPWVELQEVGNPITIITPNEKYYYKAVNPTSNKEYISEFAISPRVCCYLEANPHYDYSKWAETFELSGTRGCIPAENISDQYHCNTRGNLNRGDYTLVKKAIDAGADETWFTSKKGHTQELTDPDVPSSLKTNDGYLLIDADWGTYGQAIYKRRFCDLCPNTLYEFSAFIGNAGMDAKGAPVNATFEIYLGGTNVDNTGTPFRTVSTGNIGSNSGWKEYGLSFNSGTNECVYIALVDNVPHSEYPAGGNDHIGNDVMVDDIRLSTCAPIVQIYSASTMDQKDVTACTTPNNDLYTLYAGGDIDLTTFFDQPWYLFQKFEAGEWKNQGTPKTDPTLDVHLTEDFANGVKYRVWTGASASAVQTSADNNSVSTGCSAITAVSEPITLTYHCDCQASPEPTVENYIDCPSDTKLDLNTLITNRSTTGTYTWYTSNAENAPALSATEVQNIDVSQYNATNPTRTYYVSYDQDGSAVETYCPSPKVKVEVTVKKTYDIVNNIIPGDLCRSFLPYTDKLWVNERIVDPTTIFHWYIIDENGNVLQDLGTSKSVPWGQEPSDSETDKYVKIPIDENAPSEFRMRLTGESASTCANTIDFVMYNIYDDTNFSLSGTTEVCAAAPEVTLNLTNMSGTGDLVIKKGNTVLKTETNFSGKSYTFTDNGPHGNVDAVTYTVTFGDPDFCGTEKQHTVTIGSTLDVTLTSNTPDNSNVVCEGTKVTITSNRPDTETHTWYKNGELVENVSGNVFADPDGLVDKTIYSVNVQGLCSGTGEITINVDKKPEVALNITRYNICHGDSSTVQIDYSNPSVIIPDGSTFEWKATYSNGTSAPDAYTDFETTSASGLKEHVFERAGKYTFQLEVTNGVCETVKSEKITDYIVAGEPQFSVSASETTICQNDTTVLMITMASDLAQNATEKWTLNGADVLGTITESAQGSNTIYSMEVVPTQAGSLTYKAEVTAICTASKTIDIFVEEGIEASIEQDPEMCKGGDPVHLAVDASGNYKYTWTPNNGLSSNTEKEADASPSKTTTYTITVESEARTCSAKLTTTVHVYPLPEIVSIEETGVRQITAVADNDTEWPTFRVDDIDNVYENSPVVISNVPIGYHRLYITNEYGCENSQVFEVSPIPVVPKKFFTPNDEGDPENNYWTIDGLDAYTSWIVEIYDRYGRRLYEHRTGSFSKEGNSGSEKFKWDGTYNNHQMPSDDYWYLITVEEIRKQYSGHFTLKR